MDKICSEFLKSRKKIFRKDENGDLILNQDVVQWWNDYRLLATMITGIDTKPVTKPITPVENLAIYSVSRVVKLRIKNCFGKKFSQS